MPITSYMNQRPPFSIDTIWIKPIDNGDGTITIPENFTFRVQDVLINTSDYSLAERTFSVPLGFNGSIRFTLNGNTGFHPDNPTNVAPRSFYLGTKNVGNCIDDYMLAMIYRDASTGVISISATTQIHQDFYYVGANVIWVDAVNGSDSNPGTSASPVQTIRQAVELLSPYPNIWLKIQPGNYTIDFEFPVTTAVNIEGVDSTNKPNITVNVKDHVIGLPALQFINLNKINLTLSSGYFVQGEGASFLSHVGLASCTVNLGGGTFGDVAEGCYPNVYVGSCTIIKPSIYLFWINNAASINFFGTTIQDGSGNALTVADVVKIVRDSSGTIRNFLSKTIL